MSGVRANSGQRPLRHVREVSPTLQASPCYSDREDCKVVLKFEGGR